MSSPVSLQTSLFKEIGKTRPSFLRGVKPLLVTSCKNFAITGFEFFEHGSDLYMSAFSSWTTDNSKKYKLWFVLYDWRVVVFESLCIARGYLVKEGTMLTRDWRNVCSTTESLRKEYEDRFNITLEGSREIVLGGISFYISVEYLEGILETNPMYRVLIEREIKDRIDPSKLRCLKCGRPLDIITTYDDVHVQCFNHSCRAYRIMVELGEIYHSTGDLESVRRTVEEAVKTIKNYYGEDIIKKLNEPMESGCF